MKNFADSCGVAVAPLLCEDGDNKSATAQEGAALLSLEGKSAPPHCHSGPERTPTEAHALASPEKGSCSKPQKIARFKKAQHLVEVLRRCGWVLQADADCTWLECHRPLGRMARAEWQELAPEVHAVLLAEQGGPRPYPHR